MEKFNDLENKLEDIDILERVEMLENVRKMINNIKSNKSNEIEKLFLKKDWKDCEDKIFEFIFLFRELQKNEEEGDVESYINNSTKLRELIENNSKCWLELLKIIGFPTLQFYMGYIERLNSLISENYDNLIGNAAFLLTTFFPSLIVAYYLRELFKKNKEKSNYINHLDFLKNKLEEYQNFLRSKKSEYSHMSEEIREGVNSLITDIKELVKDLKNSPSSSEGILKRVEKVLNDLYNLYKI
ncbi:MAG: hypothetical protein QW678_00115 [Candidatus Aenigmatarchaeota archaeon]